MGGFLTTVGPLPYNAGEQAARAAFTPVEVIAREPAEGIVIRLPRGALVDLPADRPELLQAALSALAGESPNRLADLVPLPRKHRHRSHGVFAPNHKLRRAVTALAIGNVGKRGEASTGGHGGTAHAAEGCCDTQAKLRSHDTSRIVWAKLLARAGEEFPLQCPNCGGDIRLIAFITEPGPIRKILTPRRAARASARLTGPGTAHRLG